MTALAAPATRTAAFRADRLSKTYGSGPAAVAALDDVSVAFDKGRFTAIMGPSGSGKSTLLHCLAGLDAPTAGSVWLGETNLSVLSDAALTAHRRERMGFIFQAFNLLPMLTARDNITLPLKLASRRVDSAAVERVARALGIDERLAHLPSQLSGGQQQRVAVARALITEPDVVFADEPTGALDSASSKALMDLLRRSVDELGQTLVMVTHDPVVAAHSDRVLMLRDGRISGDFDAPTVDRVAAALRQLEA